MVRHTRLADKFHFYEGEGFSSNSCLIDADTLTLVDTGIGHNVSKLLEAIRDDGFDPEGIKSIINTHGHPDHVGGNAHIVRLSNAKVIMHKADAKILVKWAKLFTPLSVFGYKPPKVDDYLGVVVDLGVVALRVIHTPGHSPGSVCLYDEKRKVLISGDTAFAYGVGRWDLPGGNLSLLRQSLEKISQLDIEYLLPGHSGYLAGSVEVQKSFEFCKSFLRESQK